MGRILRITEVIERTGLSRASIYRLMKSGDFPKRVKLSVRMVGWREQDIQEWLDNLTQIEGSWLTQFYPAPT
ncbi:AlpA family transcriptional regulator [Ruegeria sp. HKCCD4332]|uniref:helix-turn-helix transcriptional regulator n=1 Tax=Ruegeria sp. HKCCD4332 TaxID=2683021 RepID=UPI0014924243|nr:AlpA family transcriptional regulator [Ruegeria sp. HKCCD4332]NOD78910.1 AlpA family phage regulatory protein [Ruegeria sp. HKCCD4332]